AKLPAGATTRFLIAEGSPPQTIAVVRTRAEARGVQTVIADPMTFEFRPGVIGALLQYPLTDGKIEDYRAVCERAHAAGALVTVATDLLALTLLKPPGEWGADIAVGNSQRFGVPLGYRVVHSTFFDTLCVEVESWALPRLIDAARARRINLRTISPTRIGVSLDEATTLGDLADLVAAFSLNEVLPFMVEDLGGKADTAIPDGLRRSSSYLTHPVFHRYRSETEMLRYIKR